MNAGTGVARTVEFMPTNHPAAEHPGSGAELRGGVPVGPERVVTFAGVYERQADGTWQAVRGAMSAAPDAPSVPQRRGRLSQRTSRAVATIALVAVSGTAGAGLSSLVRDQLRVPLPPPLMTVQAEDLGHPAELYEQVSPSVVTLTTSAGSIGSGFIYQRGLILTNAHVLAGAPSGGLDLQLGQAAIEVLDTHGRTREGTLVAFDTRLDLAMVRVEGLDDLPALPLGEVDLLKIGQPVWLFGSPFGIVGTMSSGHLTGVQVNTTFRQTPVQVGLLMTDATSNPGNSGGPMVTADGVVIGVVTLRPDEAQGRAVHGLTFALPADAVAWAATYLARGEQPPYGVLGVHGRTATPDDVVSRGVVVEHVSEELPAARAGVREGDVIVAVDGREIVRFEELTAKLRTVAVGERLTLEVVRDGTRQRLQLTVAERPTGF
jgi:putative serine protease PepD